MSYLNGPWRFRLVRCADVSGVSGTGHIADGCAFSDGTCALRWRSRYKSTAIYASLDDLVTVHGHEGTTAVEWLDERPSPYAFRGADDCTQDAMENAPFGSVGGLASRDNLQRPPCVTEVEWPEYRRGYEAAAESIYGADWRTCEFSWKPALVIP